MLRSERRRVSEVHWHRRQENRGAGAPAQLDDRRKIAGEIIIHDVQTRSVAADLLAQKHLHSLPLSPVGWTRAKRVKPLAQTGGLHQQAGSHEGQPRRLTAKDRSCSEWPHHLVVPGVNHPEITLPRRAVPGDFPDHMRIDRRHRGIDDLELMVWIARPENPFELAGKTVSRLGNSHCRRLPENKNADGAWRLRRVQGQGLRRARQRRRKKTPAEFGVFDQQRASLVTTLQKEGRRVAVTRQAQTQFSQTEKKNREEQRDDTKPALPAPRRGHSFSRARCLFLWRQSARAREVLRSSSPGLHLRPN